MKKMKVRVTFFEEVLGSSSNNPDVYSNFIADKLKDPEKIEEEKLALGYEEPDPDDVMDKMMTVFPRDEEDRPFMWDYQWKGFFKDSCGMLRNVSGSACSKIKAYKKKIDGLIFPQPRKILFLPMDGKKYVDIGKCERPLRASTAQGERIALANSETVPKGTKAEFSILIMNDDLVKMVKECLDYGCLHGFSQWRNSGKGRFTWECLGVEDANVKDIASLKGEEE